LPAPPVRTTPNINFRISAYHGYPEERLHTTTGQPAAPPKGCVYCACRTKASRGPRGPAGDHAQQLLLQALCTAPATRMPAAGQAATMRAAAPPAGPVYCTCHTNASRGRQPRARRRPRAQHVLRLPHESQPRESQPRPNGAHARNRSARRLCVLRLPNNSVV